MSAHIPLQATLVLAGGAGSRIGGDKPLRLLGGVALIDRACRRAALEPGPFAVAVRTPDQLGGRDYPTIRDAADIEGPLGGLAAGLAWARDLAADALLTLPCDMPFLPDDLGRRLGQCLGGHHAAIAASGGHLHPVCALWRIETLDIIPDYLASGRRSLKGLAARAGFVAVDWPAAPHDPFLNVNDEGGLARAESLLRP